MSNDNADRNLLFGIIAVQMDFISRDQLVDAMQAWTFNKASSLGEILCNQGALPKDTQALLESLVKKHLTQHGESTEKSLASIGAADTIRNQLKQVVDPDVQASLSQLPSDRTEQVVDPFATIAPTYRENDAADQTAREGSFASNPPTFPSNYASDRTEQVVDPFATLAPTFPSGDATDRTERDAPSSGRAPAAAGPRNSGGNRFRILRPHAKGGLGEVHVARDEELHREVALKQIQDRHADNVESQGRFLLEAEITGGLEHPGIVPVYGLGQYADGRPYYAMRFIRGGSLKDALEKFHKADVPGRDPSERSLELRGLLGRFIDVCDAIAYAHSRGVLHRDLKPGNIMLGKYGETLVVDWGLAKTVDSPVRNATEPTGVGEGNLTLHSGSLASQTVMGSTVGTPQFMSPEQAAGRLDQLGPASDVYSLGATLYCVLTGQPPYIGPDVNAILHKVKRSEFPKPREIKPIIAPALEAICLKAMALTPANRYATPRLLAEDIEHWLADEPVSAWREPWSVRARRWMSRHRTLVAGSATAVLVASVALGAATILLTAANKREHAARTLAQQKEKEAREQRDEANRQKELAEHNYRLARGAVDRYHTEVSESVLLHEPGMQPLRKKLLEAAREFYDQFVREHANDPGVQGELAHSLFRLAQITGDIASERKAIDLHNEARTIYSTLVEAHPGDRELQSDLATCLHHLGRLYRRTNQFAPAEQTYKDALVRWDALATTPDVDARIFTGQARSQLGLGNVYEMTSQLEEARKFYQTSLTAREKLAKNHPEVVEYQRDLAVSQHNLAMVQGALGLSDQAELLYGEALKIQKQLAKASPHISQYQNDLARTHYNLGDMFVQAGLSARAETPYKEAERIWSELTRLHPEVLDFQMNRADAFAALSTMYNEIRETAKAEDAAQQAIALKKKLADEQKDVPQYRGDLARAYFQLGNVRRAGNKAELAEKDYRQAEDILQGLVDTHPRVPQFQNDLARCVNNRGLLHDERAEKEPSEKAFLKALGLWRKLQAAYPHDREFALGVSRAATNLGDLLVKNNDRQGALDWYRQALAALSPDDRDAAVRDSIRNTHWKRAEALTGLGRHAIAIDDWNRAVDFASDAQRPWYQLYRARALARMGEHARADMEAKLFVGSASKSGEASFQLACAYALCSAATAKDAMLSMEERRKLSEQHAASAMQFLAQALSLGYFKTAAHFEKLSKEADLDSLRPRMEFRKFLSDIEPPKGT